MERMPCDVYFKRGWGRYHGISRTDNVARPSRINILNMHEVAEGEKECMLNASDRCGKQSYDETYLSGSLIYMEDFEDARQKNFWNRRKERSDKKARKALEEKEGTYLSERQRDYLELYRTEDEVYLQCL